MTNTSLAHVLDAARALHQATPLLSGFAPWPVDIMPAPVAPLHVPAADLVAALGLAAPARCRPFVDAIRAATAHAHWKRTYTEAEVGADFLARYGYFELFGPTGHFHSHQLRGYIAYWGEGLNYDWHHHEAE